MPRAGQQAREDEGGLEDRISVGVLARAFPRELVDEVIDAAGARERRRRVLPAWLTLYFMLALALFMDRGALRVMRKLAGVLAWAEHGVMVSMPSEEALSNARARLGAEPLRLLFGKVAGPVAPPGAAGAWWRGLRLVSLDGTTLDAQDEQANWQRFGGPSTKNAEGKRLRGAFPQVRLVALAECGTRALIGAVPGAFSTGEKTLARELIGKLGGGMLCLADRNFACWECGGTRRPRARRCCGGSAPRFPCPSMRCWATAGSGIVLRSKTPDGVVQEVWALLCAYHAVRELISAAAALAAEDPLRICFINALDVICGRVGTPGSFSPSPG